MLSKDLLCISTELLAVLANELCNIVQGIKQSSCVLLCKLSLLNIFISHFMSLVCGLGIQAPQYGQASSCEKIQK